MKKTLLAVALMTAASAASANVYFGINAGQAKFSGEKDFGAGIALGADVLPFLGVEIGFQGHVKNEYKEPLTTDVNLYEQTEKLDSGYIALKPQIRLGDFNLFGKIGRHAWRADTETKYFSNDELVESESTSGNGMMYALGADYFFTEGFSAGVMAQKYKTKNGDVDHIGLNMTIYFM